MRCKSILATALLAVSACGLEAGSSAQETPTDNRNSEAHAADDDITPVAAERLNARKSTKSRMSPAATPADNSAAGSGEGEGYSSGFSSPSLPASASDAAPPIGGALPSVTPANAVVAAKLSTPMGFVKAPAIGVIKYAARRGSVMLYVPKVNSAQDYRAFVLEDRIRTVTAGQLEHVTGAVIACAGLRQHNQCDQSEVQKSFGPNFNVPDCGADPRTVSVAKQPLQELQIEGLKGKVTVVVEAIDKLCAFPGAFGAKHADIECVYDGVAKKTATVLGNVVDWAMCPKTFPVRTEAEIRAQYGSLILNGQAPALAIADGSPWESIGLAAPRTTPRVLAREVVEVEALDPQQLPAEFGKGDFFETFEATDDQPVEIDDKQIVSNSFDVVEPHLYQTRNLSLYSYGADYAQWFMSHGTLRSVLPDWQQAIMASHVFYPRRTFQLPDANDRFVHVTFETPTDATQRRYWWFHACGAAESGKTLTADGRLAAAAGIVPEPGFMNPLEGYTVSTAGWNCLQIIPRGGGYDTMAGGPYDNAKSRPETDLRIVINPALPGISVPRDSTAGVINVSPAMDEGVDASLEGGWMRQWDASKKITGVLLDDKMYVEQRAVYDVYFNRGRIVVYADGVQKVCNDFPRHQLTMAEAAVGVGHVLYHTVAEREELMREDWLRTGQSHYLHNTPFLDQRSFDNFGVREAAALPSGFQEGQCYSASN